VIGRLVASLISQPKRPELVFEVFLHCLTLYFVDRGRSVTSVWRKKLREPCNRSGAPRELDH
jgi:hypothetical protein